MQKHGILFDYNGVIVDDEHIQEKAMANVLIDLGVGLTHDQYNEHCLGRTDEEAFENLIHLFNRKLGNTSARELTKRKIEEYTQLIRQESIIHPAIRTVLTGLQKKYRLGVVTASLRAEVMPVLEQEKLADFFEIIVTADDIRQGKPDPEGYEKGIMGLRLPKEKVVVVEDTPSGVIAAKAAGVKCIAVLHTVSQEKLGAADKVVKSVGEITPKLMNRLMQVNQPEA